MILHGGAPGLAPGELILPASKTDAIGHAPDRPATAHYDRNRVYVTSGLDYAQLFAYLRDGAVYEVEPLGQVMHDPDSLVAPSWSCRRARILSVVVPAPAPMPESVNPKYVAQLRAAKRLEASA